jgi:hypothetical protein
LSRGHLAVPFESLVRLRNPRTVHVDIYYGDTLLQRLSKVPPESSSMARGADDLTHNQIDDDFREHL